MQIAYPFALTESGAIATADEDAHLRQMIEQVLFTNPGERVNRPDFGCGLEAMVFEPISSEMIAVTQALVRANLLKWLGDRIQIINLVVEAVESSLVITLDYAVLGTLERRVGTFVR
jgi:phage baseplate assembly protein W